MKKLLLLVTVLLVTACGNLPVKQAEPTQDGDALVAALVTLEGRYKDGGDAGINGKITNGIELTFQNYYTEETVKVRTNSRGLVTFNAIAGDEYELVKIYYYRRVGDHEVEIDKEIDNSPIFKVEGGHINNFGEILYTIYPKEGVKMISITNYDSSFDFIANYLDNNSRVVEEFERANKNSAWLEKEWIDIQTR